MTPDQRHQLAAAKNELFLYALLYARISTERDDTFSIERKLCLAAKTFTRIVDAIDPKLWESPSPDAP